MSAFQQTIHQLRILKEERDRSHLLKLLKENLEDLLDAADYADKHGFKSLGAVVSMTREDLDALDIAYEWAIKHGYVEEPN